LSLVPLVISYLQAEGRTSPGKKLFQIRIVDRHGLLPGKARLAARAVAQMFPLWCLVVFEVTRILGLSPIGWLFVAIAHVIVISDASIAVFTRNRRSIHDLVFDTRVVLDASTSDR
jgi:uncharacterized RDD family membrane protein YckC